MLDMAEMRKELESVFQKQAEEFVQSEIQRREEVLRGQFNDAVQSKVHELSLTNALGSKVQTARMSSSTAGPNYITNASEDESNFN